MPLSTPSPSAVERYDEGIDLLLSGNLGAEEKLAQALEADEGFALGHAALAAAFQLHGQVQASRASAARAQELTAGVTRREQQHVAAIATLAEGDGRRALALTQEHLAEFPRDVVLLAQTGSLWSGSGRSDRHAELFGLLTSLAPAYGDDWYFLGSYAFVHHELDRFEESRRLSERSLALYPRNAQATHNLAHIFYETNDHAAGRGFLTGWMVDYPDGAPVHCHLAWHQALFELSSGHYSRVMELYRSAIDPTLVQARTLLADTASLLWRLHIYGCADGPLPWPDVRDLAARLTARPGFAFGDAHAALAYAGAGDEAAMAALLGGLRELATNGSTLVAEVVLPLALGIQAFASEAYEEAIGCIEPIMDQLVRIGGSHAQREVFEDTLLQAYLRAGRYDAAEALLRRRVGRRHSARDFFWLGRAQAAQGQLGPAAESLDTAARAWSDAEPHAPESAALRQARQAVRGESA